METEIIIVLTIMAFTIFMLVTEIIRIDVTALITMLALSWTGILTTNEALAGFSSNAVVAMIAVMILGEGMAKTGMMSRFSKWLLKRVGSNKSSILGSLSLSVGTLSGVIQNIGAAALFLPSIMDISRRTKISASVLIMPIGFAAIIGGTLTMVGSGHLILTNDLLANADLDPYGLFAVTPVGIALLVAAVLFFVLLGKYFLPQESTEGESKLTEQEKIIEAFSLNKDIRYFRVENNCELTGKTIEQSGIWSDYNINLLALRDGNNTQYSPWRETVLKEGQVVALYGEVDDVNRFTDDKKLSATEDHIIFESIEDPEESGFVEVIVPPRSDLVGQTIREFSMRKRYAVEPIMLFSQGENVDDDFSDHKIKAGDTFIIYGTWKNIKELQSSDPFIVTTPISAEMKDPSKTWQAAGSFLLAIVLAMSGFSISIAFLTGAVMMVLTNVMSIQQAYKSIEWKVVFLLVGLIPLGTAMQNSGTAQFLAENVMSVIEGSHLLVLLFTVGILSTGFSLVMSNVGAVVVLAPLVVGIGALAGVDPRPLVLLAAVNAGNSFVLPTHQVNALMMSAGGYKTKDYFKAGGGMTIVFLVVSVLFFYYTFF
ncbi:SLC13 family permease [Rhodohalobacter barkolensis]|uniref:SLC13 family permease n=1 Tax=Rhodohalobacter barkolensis TaxID=2053187 RepID=A0A2N0VGG7_9BACT|nr:SLC13 family permease [Rhodohalobacter barkolensis]PKD43296.1 SLC13 family permease [Rhodohalobacter barkolensis]